MARRWHPDSTDHEEYSEAHERMALINEAKEVLSDRVRRKQYDNARSGLIDGRWPGQSQEVSCRPKLEPNVINFQRISRDLPSKLQIVSVRPDPEDSWPEGQVVDLSPKSGEFWQCIGFERSEPDVVVAYKIESTVPSYLKPGNYIETATVSFGNEVAELTLRALVGEERPRKSTSDTRSTASSFTAPSPLASASVTPPGSLALRVFYGILGALFTAAPICLWAYIFNSHPSLKLGRIGSGWGLYFSIVLSIVLIVAGLRICFTVGKSNFTVDVIRSLNKISIALGITLLTVLVTEYWPVSVMYTDILKGPGPTYAVQGARDNIIEFICGVSTFGGNGLIIYLLFRMGKIE